LKSAKERLERLEGMIKTERTNLSKLEEQNAAVAEDIAVAEQGIAKLKEELSTVQEVLEAKTRVVDQVKKTTSKASKVLDQALKEIATAVGCLSFLRSLDSQFLQNDEIEKLALDRSATYRKCRLEEVKLPLLEGNLKNVPMEEVCTNWLTNAADAKAFLRISEKMWPWTLMKTRMELRGLKWSLIMELRSTLSLLRMTSGLKTRGTRMQDTIRRLPTLLRRSNGWHQT
jgi:chromosome segregation ATPase